MNPRIFSVAGELLSGIGTWSVAYEIVKQFRGVPYEVQHTDATRNDVAKETPEYKRWERKRKWYLAAGLALISVGTLSQMAGSWFTR